MPRRAGRRRIPASTRAGRCPTWCSRGSSCRLREHRTPGHRDAGHRTGSGRRCRRWSCR
jgi:hypothetical protein